MTAPADSAIPSPPSPPAQLACLGRAPLMAGEDAADFDTLLTQFSATVRPRDVVEEAWVRDVVNLVWEAARLRRLKAALMTACADQGMQKLLEGLNVRETHSLARRWAARELTAVGQVDAILAAAGLGIEHVMARTLRQTIAEIVQIDRLIASVERRRAATMREIAHYREQFAAQLRGALHKAEKIADADFEVVAPPLAQAEASEAAECVA
ncbi:MAG TPA: hypothetical protein VLX44_16420 [Xanthobacteraceae bacterium]|nr:hypothetical protein [Xanthobacteraceae bacterium]